jgi:hypothetical protein
MKYSDVKVGMKVGVEVSSTITHVVVGKNNGWVYTEYGHCASLPIPYRAKDLEEVQDWGEAPDEL